MHKNFIKCGFIGWTLEIVSSAIYSFITSNDWCFIGKTSLLMFPIYGLAAIFCPIARVLQNFNFIFRGLIYTVLIYVTEYTTGWILRQFSMCPWDYGNSRFSIHGLIRLDFTPIWFTLGLIFEKVCCPCKKCEK
jgi:uncharacterized membrane protein